MANEYEEHPGKHTSAHGGWYFSCDSQYYKSVLVGRHSEYTRTRRTPGDDNITELTELTETFNTTCPVLGLQFIPIDTSEEKDLELLIKVESTRPVLPRSEGHDQLNFYVIPTQLLYTYNKITNQSERRFTKEDLRKKQLVATTEIGLLIIHSDYE